MLLQAEFKEKFKRRVYFISDGSPIDNFLFLKPLCLSRKKTFPTLVIPTQYFVALSRILEIIYHVTKRLGITIDPLLTRAEVHKVGVTHYFSIKKAQRELQYKPLFDSHEGARRLGEYYRKLLTNTNYFETPSPFWWSSIGSGMFLLGLIAFKDENNMSFLLQCVNQLGLSIFQSKINLQRMFYIAVALHILEGVAAFIVAFRNGMNTAPVWGLQTVLLGFASFRLLLKRLEEVPCNSSYSS